MRVRIRPRPGVKIRDPRTLEHLPEEGKEVELDTYWRRRLKSQDVELIPPDQSKPAPDAETSEIEEDLFTQAEVKRPEGEDEQTILDIVASVEEAAPVPTPDGESATEEDLVPPDEASLEQAAPVSKPKKKKRSIYGHQL